MADEVKTCECTARAALEKCFETGRLHISVDSEEHAALSATCPCEGLREENDRLKLLDAPVEREVRIKYQDIVYAACNLIDRAMGHTISNGVLAERGEFETAIRAIVSERDSLRAELAAADTEAAKLLEYSRSVKGSRDVHSIYEVLDLLPALRAEMATAKSDADRWRKAHDGILAEAARMTGEASAELAASQERERVLREALKPFGNWYHVLCAMLERDRQYGIECASGWEDVDPILGALGQVVTRGAFRIAADALATPEGTVRS